MLGIHLFTVANNSLYIGGDTQVIVVNSDGMTVEDAEDVRAFEERIATFNTALARLVLACPDVGIEPDEFRKLLNYFAEQIADLHDQYTGKAMLSHLEKFLDKPNLPYYAYKKLPLELMIKICKEELSARELERVEEELSKDGLRLDSETSEKQ